MLQQQPRSVLAGPIMPPRTVLSLRSILLLSLSHISVVVPMVIAVVALATFSLIPTQCICIFCVYLREPPIENAHTLFCRMRFFFVPTWEPRIYDNDDDGRRQCGAKAYFIYIYI